MYGTKAILAVLALAASAAPALAHPTPLNIDPAGLTSGVTALCGRDGASEALDIGPVTSGATAGGGACGRAYHPAARGLDPADEIHSGGHLETALPREDAGPLARAL